MSGLLPMSVALIASAALLMMNRENFIDYKSIGIFAAAFLVTWKWNLHPILLICLAGVVGMTVVLVILMGKRAPRLNTAFNRGSFIIL